jgi:flagellar hook-basal body complex protein FliE
MQIPAINSFDTSQIGAAQGIKKPASTNPAQAVEKSFDQVLNSLSDSQQNVDSLTNDLASGGTADVANVMVAAEENDVNFRVTLAIRDRLVDAYREVMRMSI